MCTPPAFTQSSPHRDGTRSTTSAPLPSSCHPGFSPTLIHDPVDISSPQTAISPGAPLARSRLSASGFSLLHASRPTVSRSPHRFICPRSPSHLRAQPITALSSADIRPTRIFHVSEFHDTLRSPNVPPNRHVPSIPSLCHGALRTLHNTLPPSIVPSTTTKRTSEVGSVAACPTAPPAQDRRKDMSGVV